MKKTVLSILLGLISFYGYSQSPEDVQKQIDSIESTFTYQKGTIELRNGIGKITVPKGFKYLDATQSERVIVDIWGNPKGPDLSLGMILPENQGVLSDKGYVFNIQYDEIGYVEDDDADDVDYDELLEQMQEETEEANKERTQQGYEAVSMVGWATKPFYDKDRKILFWAKELKFGSQEVNTLNYNVRVLGRKGVIVLNAIATINDLPEVKKDIHKVLNIVQFNDGYKYSDFDSSVDEVATWTIGSLVAGKILAKVGFFAILLKFWKVLAIAIVGGGSFIWNKFKKKKEEEIQPEVISEEVEKKSDEVQS